MNQTVLPIRTTASFVRLRFARGVGRGYIGQSNQVTVPLGGAVDREKYGYFHDDVPAEIVNLRVLGELMN